MKLSQEMIQYRAKHDLSQADLGRKCGVNVMTINFVERELQTPSARTEAKIRIVLNSDKEEK